MFNSILETILTYGSVCWQFSKEDKKKVGTVKILYLGRVYRTSIIEWVRNKKIRRRDRQHRIETLIVVWSREGN